MTTFLTLGLLSGKYLGSGSMITDTDPRIRIQIKMIWIRNTAWSTHTVIGTKIGVNPHGESISTNLPGVQINHSSLLLINKFIELSNDTLIVKIKRKLFPQ